MVEKNANCIWQDGPHDPQAFKKPEEIFGGSFLLNLWSGQQYIEQTLTA